MKAFRFKFWNLGLAFILIIWAAAMSLFPFPGELLRSRWSFIPLGFGGAVLGNISAVGGGILFIPAMMFIFHLAPVLSLKVAIGSQAFGMTSGAVARLQKKRLPLGVFWISVPSLLAGSSVSSFLIHPRALFIKILFGPVSIGLGVVTLYLSRVRRERPIRTYEEVKASLRVPLLLISFLGGLVTGWIAIGEGELISALLMLAYGMEASICIGIGVVLLSVNSIYLALIHQIFLGGLPWDIIAFTSIGCILGARFSVSLSNRVSGDFLKRVFACIAIADGCVFIFQYFSQYSHPGS